ncbi:rhodanese-like domain-containing protein [Mongoliitalea daihaiensis]|uniref:rhodanese-like domain-containing protein n=1 Tax=Mongoliitalea daihaiensis TaxID=2782006 RepID=UPI001F40AEE3|nr:rhodanese-like domain-containing protein [Mongoliitalea daihaiensis]UJP65230.1 rhodanese-like domain-containing protein [Mongoliitalea daihaiensis]
MHKLITIATLALALFTVVSCQPNESSSSNAETVKGKIHRLKADEFYQMSTETPGIVLDVRTQAEFKQAKLANAVLMDIYKADFEKQIQTLPKDQAIYVYCTVGARSMQAARLLQKHGFEKIYNLEGGIMDWARYRYPIAQ